MITADETIIHGYPSIPGILRLGAEIERVFEDGETVVTEEKPNGFNVRIADVGEPLAFTRSGYVCPYTTAQAKELLDLSAFFEAYPDAMLCGELIGPESPYPVHHYDDIRTNESRIFGIRHRIPGEPQSVDRRQELCEECGFPQPRVFGGVPPEDASDIARMAIDELETAEREGLVLKTATGEIVTKYATAAQIRNDLEYAFTIPFESGRDFIFSRVIREGFQAVDFEEDDNRLQERAHSLGEAILNRWSMRFDLSIVVTRSGNVTFSAAIRKRSRNS